MRKRLRLAVQRILHKTGPLTPMLLSLGSLILVWEASGRVFEFHPETLPTPTQILRVLWEQAPRLRAHGLISACAIFCGFFLAAICSIPSAFVIGLLPVLDRAASTILLMLRPAPLVIVVPLIFVWFGYGLRPEILIAFILGFIAMTVGIVRGLSSFDPAMADLLKTMGSGRVQVFLKARLPAALPHIFSSLKMAVPLVVAGTTAGEFAQAEMGLGYLMLASAFKMETPLVFAGLTVLGLIGLALYGLISLLESLFVYWQVEMTG